MYVYGNCFNYTSIFYLVPIVIAFADYLHLQSAICKSQAVDAQIRLDHDLKKAISLHDLPTI